MKPDLIVTFGTPAARAALEATKSIPVVFIGVGDPLGTSLVPSLAKPGGNGTGVSLLGTELGTKRLDLLHQLAPGLGGVLTWWIWPMRLRRFRLIRCRRLLIHWALRLRPTTPTKVKEIGTVLRKIPWKSIDGVLIGGDPIFTAEVARIAKAVRAAKVPAVFPYREFHKYGVLMSYSPDVREQARQGAHYVDKILKCAKPADLPVEQVSKVDLIIRSADRGRDGNQGVPRALVPCRRSDPLTACLQLRSLRTSALG